MTNFDDKVCLNCYYGKFYNKFLTECYVFDELTANLNCCIMWRDKYGED